MTYQFGADYLSKRHERNDFDRNSENVSPTETHSLKSLEFCESPELDLYASTPKDLRLEHRLKNKAKKDKHQQQKLAKDYFPFGHNGFLTSVFDSESEANDVFRSSFCEGRKNLTKTRKSERNLKQNTNQGSFLEGGDNACQSSSNSLPPIIVTSQKYKCLESMPVGHGLEDTDLLMKATKHSFASLPQPFSCSTDRVSFYKNFSLLIDLGKGREKDMRRHVCSRQMSSEEELWRSQFGDVVWLELQAFLNQLPPSKQDSIFIRQRESIPKIFEKILQFRVLIEESSDQLKVGGISFSASSRNSKKSNFLCICENNDDVVGLYTSSKSIFGVCPGRILQSFCDSASQITQILGKLNLIDSLYPTQKALTKGCPMYEDENLKGRISSLYLWFNVSRDLFQQLKFILDLVTTSKHKDFSLWSCIDSQKLNCLLQTLNESHLDKRDKFFKKNDSPISDNSNILSYLTDGNSDNESTEGDIEKIFSDEDDDDDDIINEDGDCESENDCLDKKPCNSVSNQSSKAVSFIDSGLIQKNVNDGLNHSRPLSKSSITSSESLELLSISTTSVYRHYVDNNLKRTGMRKFCSRLRQMMDKTLSKAQQALMEINSVESCKEETKISDFMNLMNLPSFSCIYLFLCRVPLDVMHECLKLRLERQPKREPSFHILKPLIHECKEVLRASIDLKQYYLGLVSSHVFASGHETEMEKFEDDLMKMMQLYFNYMQHFMTELQQLPEMSKQLKNFLEREWNFMKRICSFVRNGDAYAGNRFCAMACGLIRSISDFLDSKIDDCVNQLFANSSLELSKSGDESLVQRSKSTEFRQSMVQLGRDLKLHFNEARERSCKALAFAKMLKKDLEVAAQYVPSVSSEVIFTFLNETNHVQVVFSEKANYLMFVPEHIASNKAYICHLLNVSCGSEDCFPGNDISANQNKSYTECLHGYLVLTKMENSDLVWQGKSITIEPTAEATIAFVHMEVNGWLLIASHSLELMNSRKSFESLMGRCFTLRNEQMSCYQATAESLHELKTCALDLRTRVVEGLTRVSERLNDAELVDVEESEKHNVLKSNKETINYCFTFGFEYHKELMRLISGDLKETLSRSMIEFARQWMKFAESCDRGRGVKPRWAYPGFDFIKISCEPRNLEYLNDTEFMALTKDINSCISHVIGTKPSGCSPDVAQKSLIRNFSSTSRKSYASPSRSVSNASSNLNLTPNLRNASFSIIKTSSGESYVDDVTDDMQNALKVSRQSWKSSITNSIKSLEKERNEKLMREKVIGRISDAKVNVDSGVRMRKVKFRWQRGIKIGEGQFGKVYIAINLDNDVLMAMKEIKLQPNDHQAIKKIDEEIKTFEGIKHPSLVQYFGVELYRDEMIIFMEYCQNGTIEDLAKQGLDEHMIRKYSNEILQAIYVLHSHNIVHRDIKGANIFLTPNNSIKLGDFGCSVKLTSHTTISGELNGYVGTPAFMAPEVIKGDAIKGYGRAADIWSFGCVIIQLTTGKRPWPDLDSRIQIYYKVGIGAIPHIPDMLSEEGKEFLTHCLDVDDEKRWTAEQLIDHPFVKIEEEDVEL